VRLILASASPRRADLLRASGFDFEVRAADVDESVLAGEDAEAYARRVALAKARAVLPGAGGRPVLAADTVVVVDGMILGKPRDAADAARMLGLVSGRTHEVLTAVVLATGTDAPSIDTQVDRTRVEVRPLSPDEIARYVASGEPMDKAGAYAVQGLAGRFIARLEGSYANVVGLPVAQVEQMLKRAGLWAREFAARV